MIQVSNLLQQLGSTEAVLMMYLSDELPAEDRAEVERRLAADPAMRAQWDRLREAHAGFAAAMPALDRATRLPAPEAVGVRRVLRAVRQWQADRVARPVAPAATPPFRFPVWAYPLAAAAAVVVAFVVWWGNSDQPQDRFAGTARPRYYELDDRPSPSDLLAMIMRETSGPIETSEEFASLVDPSDYAVLTPMMDDPGAGPAQQPGASESPDSERELDEFIL
jgi:hypothetical protein